MYQPRILMVLIPLLSIVSLCSGADRRIDLSRLTLATFNARFLFDGRPPEGEAGFPWKGDPSAARRHLREVAVVLRGVDADLLHLSEVENLETLERLVLEIGDPTYRAFLIQGRDDFTRQNVGILSRIDLDAPLRRSDLQSTGPMGEIPHGVSKNYAARITAGKLHLSLVGVHLLAFPDDPERAPRREGQAEVVRQLAAEEGTHKRRFPIVLGDFNDLDPGIVDPSGQTPITRVLEIIKQVDPQCPADDLTNPAKMLSPTERYTAFFDRNHNGMDDGLKERSLTDHILLPRSLVPAIVAIEVFSHHDPMGPSDHFPLKVTLDLSSVKLFLRGDSDHNLLLDEGDALAILKHLFGGKPLSCIDAADVNDDGRVSLTDVVYLLHFLYRDGPAPPEPSSALPGEDPTADSIGCGGL